MFSFASYFPSSTFSARTSYQHHGEANSYFADKSDWPIFIAEYRKVMHYSAESHTKIVKEAEILGSKGLKTKICNESVKDIGNRSSLEPLNITVR